MKKFALYLVLLAALAGAMFATNPDKKQFQEWVEKKMDDRLSDSAKEGIGSVLSDVISAVGAQFSQALTTREDYFLCSIFVVDMGKEEYRYLGVFNQFIPLQTKNPLDSE